MRRGPIGSGGELGLDPPAPLREARAVEEARLVQPLRDRDHVGSGEAPAMAGGDDVPDLVDRVVPVEQRDHVQERDGQHRHLLGESGRIAETDHAPPVLLDGKRLERAEAGPLGESHYPSR
jgi:hypothetical protein